MPTLARRVAAGCAHHVTQRGNNRQDVFLVDDDRRVYLELLKEQADKYGLEVQGYCLLSNHVDRKAKSDLLDLADWYKHTPADPWAAMDS